MKTLAIIAAALCLCMAPSPAFATCVEVIVSPSGHVLEQFEYACPSGLAVTVSPGSSQANGVFADTGQHLTGTPGGLNGSDDSHGLIAFALSLFGF